MSDATVVTGAVEGPVDEAVLGVLLREAGKAPGRMYGKMGKAGIVQRLRSYNEAARLDPWVVLVDLDDADCAPTLRRDCLPDPAPLMCFRIAVREVEAWLLADRERVAAFLGVAVEAVPTEPEMLPDPKQTLVNLARRSRLRAIREDMVPRPESGRQVGPAYSSRLIEFATAAEARWRPEVAAEVSDSLRRCIQRLRELATP